METLQPLTIWSRAHAARPASNTGDETSADSPTSSRLATPCEVTCKAHARILDALDYWEYNLSTDQSSSKKEGFTLKYFDELLKNSISTNGTSNLNDKLDNTQLTTPQHKNYQIA